MSVTALPGAPQFGMGTSSGIDPQGIVQLAMAVKEFKMREKQQKKAEATEKLSLLMSNPQLLLMADHKDVENALREIGIKITDQPPISPEVPLTSGQATAGGPLTGQTTVSPNAIASMGAAMQGSKAGAAAASPPSPQAAGRAPGDGVQPVGNAQLAQHLAGQAQDTFRQKFGAVAPLYASAMSQLDQERLKAQTIAEIENVKQQAMKGDVQAMGKLYMMSGKQVTDADMRAMIISSNMDPKVISQAMDFALGNETPADKAKRFTENLKTLTSTPVIMDKLTNPLDVTKIANSITYGGAIPEGVSLKPFTLNELKDEADYERLLMEKQGLPYAFAHLVARGRSMGLGPTQVVPDSMAGLLVMPSLESRRVGATERQAQAALLSAQAEKQKADDAHLKINQTMAQKDYDDLNNRLARMIDADKARKPWPNDVKEALIGQVARAAGLMPERVTHWYNWMGGHSVKYTPIPASDLAGAAAGTAQGAPPADERGPTLAERGGVVGAVRREVEKTRKDVGKAAEERGVLGILGELDPINRYVLGGKSALEYLRDILVGKPGPEAQ